MCGTGEHQLCPPICCQHIPKDLDPRKLRRKTTAAWVKADIAVCVCLFEGCVQVFDMCVCVCVSISFFRNIMSLDRVSSGTLE